MRIVTAVTTLLFVTNGALACLVPPTEYLVSAEELVARSEYVLLARSAGKREASVPEVCSELERKPTEDEMPAFLQKLEKFEDLCSHTRLEEFEVQEVLKGPSASTFSLKFPARAGSSHHSFSNHTSLEFRARGGRVGVLGSCDLSPAFEPGSLYLLLGPQGHFAAFELIEHPGKDAWLAEVRGLLASH